MEKTNKIRALLIKRNKTTNELIIEDTIFLDTLENLYKLLNCNQIDIQVRYFKNIAYDFIFDDEYLINGKSQEPKNAVAIGTRNGEILEVIFGNLLICGLADNNGNETSLNELDIKKILNSRCYAETKTKNKIDILNYTFEDETKTN